MRLSIEVEVPNGDVDYFLESLGMFFTLKAPDINWIPIWIEEQES